MSELSLRECETEVEQARARLAQDLERLRSPSALSAFANDLKREALHAKDTAVDKLKTTAQSTAARLGEELKAKAAANPTAALMIGAGVAWRLYRSPPIASALVAAGLFSLWRTSAQPSPAGTSTDDFFREAGTRLGEQVGAVAEAAARKFADAGEVVANKASELGAATVERVEQWRESAGEALGQALSTAQDTAVQAVQVATERLHDVNDRATALGAKAREATQGFAARAEANRPAIKDIVLRGIANLALVAAIGVMAQKRIDGRAPR
jgi:hypothetical protein